MASMYAVYHGPQRLRAIATEIHRKTERVVSILVELGHQVLAGPQFDTIKVKAGSLRDRVAGRDEEAGINLRHFADCQLGISLDEPTSEKDLENLIRLFDLEQQIVFPNYSSYREEELPVGVRRESGYLQHPVFNRYHTETELMRYLKRLENRDLSLTTSMIPLGACTMNVNAAVEMLPVTWPEFEQIHPFAPPPPTKGYRQLITRLDDCLPKRTAFAAVPRPPQS